MTAMTISDTERREVARRLRELPDDSTYPDLIGAIADRDGWYPAADAADRLADLIEPCCDRDALLALADEILENADLSRELHDEMLNEKRLDMALTFHEYACELREYTGRIREALGVES